MKLELGLGGKDTDYSNNQYFWLWVRFSSFSVSLQLWFSSLPCDSEEQFPETTLLRGVSIGVGFSIFKDLFYFQDGFQSHVATLDYVCYFLKSRATKTPN